MLIRVTWENELYIDGKLHEVLEVESISHAVSRITGNKVECRVNNGVRLYYVDSKGEEKEVADNADWNSKYLFEFKLPGI